MEDELTTTEPSKVFSVRLVCIDYYMAPPIPGVDDEYSSFQGGMIHEVPVVRVFGPTPAGQKTCIHIHKVFPYMYIPIPDIKHDDPPHIAEKFASTVATALDKALQLKGDAGAKRQHVHKFDLVRAKKFYGYHASEEIFLKIYFYYPRDASRAANLLLSGAVLDKNMQPHESHIPYILQFMIDYNLNGMSLVHLNKIRFRHPLPTSFTPKRSIYYKQGLNSSIGSSRYKKHEVNDDLVDSQYWLSSNIPDGWSWNMPSLPEIWSSQDRDCLQRLSKCELEGDTTIDDIINQQSKSYIPLSQTESDAKMVQTLIPLWEEEYLRTGNSVVCIAPDSTEPLPHDTLKTLVNIPEFGEKFYKMFIREDELCMLDSLPAGEQTPLILDNDNLIDTGQLEEIRIPGGKVGDHEALDLLRWLAVSQSPNDFDSDDELVRELVLTPLLLEAKFGKVIEKVNSDYDSESQRECQEILDCIEGLKDSTFMQESSAIFREAAPEKSPSQLHEHTGYQNQALPSNKKECLWGSLPLNRNPNLNNTPDDVNYLNFNSNCLLADGSAVDLPIERGESSESLARSAGGSMAISGCSVRDLMRKKRRHRVLKENSNFAEDKFREDTGIPSRKKLDFSSPDFGARQDVVAPSSYVNPSDNQNNVRCSVVRDLNPHVDRELNNFTNSPLTDNEKKRSEDSNKEKGIPHPSCDDVYKYYQNDGSLLYVLTSSLSPPSADSVSKWLHNGADGGVEMCTFSSLNDEKLFERCSSVSNYLCDPVKPVEEHEDRKSAPTDEESESKDKNIGNDAETVLSNDLSQISGPSQDSLPHSPSRTGFRDPASLDSVQMLTLISVEILSESRGDLRPDPRFDAINIISLVIQNDCDSKLETIVLLRSDSTSCEQKEATLSDCIVNVHLDEKGMFAEFVRIINFFDPDILVGWDVQVGSLGFLAERAANLGFGLLRLISRTTNDCKRGSTDAETSDNMAGDTGLHELLISDSPVDDSIIQDEWGRTHVSGVHVDGRVVLNVWRLMRNEVKLTLYTLESVVEAVLRKKIPSISNKILLNWFSSGPGRAQYKCLEFVTRRASLNLELLNHLDMVNQTSELARVFGIEFFAVLSRGSQYRVESMLLRLAHTQNILAVSPSNQQVAAQPAMECLPLVMEPESAFYADPVVVLDFQSLYPSMIIAYNLCFSTCLGSVEPTKSNILGVSQYSPDDSILKNIKNDILLTPNGVMYVPSKIRQGVMPRLLEEILSTRIMIKKAMKNLGPSDLVLRKKLNARQLALKLIANVTYGYTAAGFSGRMPCAELADSIVQCGRRTLEKAIDLVNTNENWNAKVVYGDTDSMFVHLKGRTTREAFDIGQQIASAVSAVNPNPVTLRLEKVYRPCFLLCKKRYVGYSYESPDQAQPTFDAKGIETVRRDSCGAVSKMMEKSLRLFFETQNISAVKRYLQRQWKRILSGRVSLQDFVFAKEVRLGTYSTKSSSSLPPAAIVATKAMKTDPRAEPRYAERVPYVVIHGEPGARLVDMVVDPMDLLHVASPFRLNDLYYINKQIIPALQRVFGLVGVDLTKWFHEMPRQTRDVSSKRPLLASRTRIDYYYLSRHCVLCGEMVHATTRLCDACMRDEASAAAALIGRCSKLEKEIHHLAAVGALFCFVLIFLNYLLLADLPALRRR